MRHNTPAHSSRHDAFGRAVRETRALRGLSQEQLGFAADLHRNYVGRSSAARSTQRSAFPSSWPMASCCAPQS